MVAVLPFENLSRDPDQEYFSDGVTEEIINAVVKHVKKMVPPFTIRNATSFKHAMKRGSQHHFETVSSTHDDIAFLQYTGGTTGVSKGAILTNKNMVANMLQASIWIHDDLGDQIEQTISVLFSDIRSYTSLSEQMTPVENFEFINAYLGRMGPVIKRNHGMSRTVPAVNGRDIVTMGPKCHGTCLDAETGEFLFAIDLGLQNIVSEIDSRSGAKTVNRDLLPGSGETRLAAGAALLPSRTLPIKNSISSPGKNRKPPLPSGSSLVRNRRTKTSMTFGSRSFSSS